MLIYLLHAQSLIENRACGAEPNRNEENARPSLSDFPTRLGCVCGEEVGAHAYGPGSEQDMVVMS
jgi:hypothetical protein